MKKRVLATITSFLILSGCGKETIIREVLVTAAPTTTTTEATLPPVQSKTKFDLYLDEVYDFSAQAREWSDSQLLEFGTVICEAFSNGTTLNQIVEVMEKYSTGLYDNELFAGVIYASVVHLCPKYLSLMQSQL